MIVNLKNKRGQQIDTLFHMINKSKGRTHREDGSRDSKEIRSNRVNSYAFKKTTPSGISTTTAGNTSEANTHHKQDPPQNGKNKKNKKYDLGEVYLQNNTFRETSKRTSNHKSQKITHKRDLTHTFATQQHDQDIQVTQKDSLISSLIRLFQTEENTNNKPTKEASMFKQKKHPQILIMEESMYLRKSDNQTVTTFLQQFYKKMQILQEKYNNKVEFSIRDKLEQKIFPVKNIENQTYKVITLIRSFVTELTNRVCSEQYQVMHKLQEKIKQMTKQIQHFKSEYQTVKNLLANQMKQNELLLIQLQRIQSTAINFQVIFNEISKSINLESFVKENFIPTTSKKINCFIKNKTESSQMNDFQSAYEVNSRQRTQHHIDYHQTKKIKKQQHTDYLLQKNKTRNFLKNSTRKP